MTCASVHVSHGRKPATHCPRPAKTRYRYLLGVKWSQVQILSARLIEIAPEQLRQSVWYKSNGATIWRRWGPRAGYRWENVGLCEHTEAHLTAGQVCRSCISTLTNSGEQPGVNDQRPQVTSPLSVEVMCPILAAKVGGRWCRDWVVRRVLRRRLPSGGRIGRGLFPSPSTAVARLD
jgi:hypothetical protein